MPIDPSLIDPFHRSLHERLTTMLQDRVSRLAQGSASQMIGSQSSVAENYAGQVGYIQALRDVLDVCDDLERERYGDRKPLEDR